MKNKFIIIICLLIINFGLVSLVSAQNPCGSQAGAGVINNPCPGFFTDLGGGNNTFAGIFRFIIEGLLALVGLISILFIIIGGYQYIVSRGDEEMAAAGKKTLSNAIIGLVIVIVSYTLVVVTYRALSGNP